MNAPSFKDRFSLDFLTPDAPQTSNAAPTTVPQNIEVVFASVGERLLGVLRDMPDQSTSVLNLAAASGMRFEAIQPVVQYLESRGLATRTMIDPSGNDIYKAVAQQQ